MRWAFRPIGSLSEIRFGDDPNAVRLRDPVDNEGRRYIVLRRERGQRLRYAYDYWLDPQQGYSVVRFASSANGKPRRLLECDYKLADSEKVWTPTRWTSTEFGVDGTPNEIEVGTVRSCEINVVIDARDFELEFPVGAIVSDKRPNVVGYEPRRGRALYLIKPGGQKRLIRASEWNVPYEKLLETDPGGR